MKRKTNGYLNNLPELKKNINFKHIELYMKKNINEIMNGDSFCIVSRILLVLPIN